MILDGTDDHTSHYLHAPREWKLHFGDRDAAGTLFTIRCRSDDHETMLVAPDHNRPWLSLAHLVLQLLTGWELHPRLVSLTALTLRAKASTTDIATTADLTRPLLTESIQHLARRSAEPWIASEFVDLI